MLQEKSLLCKLLELLKMSEAWLTRTQSRGELDTSSSISLARSIYGSQAYFDGGNSSYQGSEANLFRTTSQVSNAANITRHLNRPKSSPARAIAERNQKLRPSSAMPSSFGGHQFNKSRPVSAIPTHGRPTSALQRGSRPTSALQYAATSRRRPQSAAPWAMPLIEVEDYEDIAEAGQSTSRIRSANPVTLNNVPEYVKVWEGKPLLPRDYGMKHFDRKPWQRPKSDYGLRPGGWRRRKKNDQHGMTPVTSVTEVNEGSHDHNDNDDHKTKLAWGQDSGWDGNKSGDNKSLFDDGRGGKGLGDGHGRDGLDQRTGNYGDSSSNLRNTRDNSDLWASRIQPPKEDSDSDDDYFKKPEGSSGKLTPQLPSVTNLSNEKPESISRSGSIELATEPSIKLPPVTAVSKAPPPPATPWPVAKGDTGRSVLIQLQQRPVDSQWMNYRTALARHSTRFELPMDMKRLERMSPEQYLCTHCVISDRRVQHYRRIFTATAKKKTQPAQAAAADCFGYQELITAIIDAHYQSLCEEEIHKVIDVVGLLPEQSVDFTLFCGVCALTERMYRDKFISSQSTGAVQEYGRYKEIVEDADFEALEWKLRGCKISKSLRNLFSQL